MFPWIHTPFVAGCTRWSWRVKVSHFCGIPLCLPRTGNVASPDAQLSCKIWCTAYWQKDLFMTTFTSRRCVIRRMKVSHFWWHSRRVRIRTCNAPSHKSHNILGTSYMYMLIKNFAIYNSMCWAQKIWYIPNLPRDVVFDDISVKSLCHWTFESPISAVICVESPFEYVMCIVPSHNHK